MNHEPAIITLEIAKDIADQNAPINDMEGRTEQAALERTNSAAFAKAIEVLKAA